jgi:hypothetical protein
MRASKRQKEPSIALIFYKLRERSLNRILADGLDGVSLDG